MLNINSSQTQELMLSYENPTFNASTAGIRCTL